MDGTIREKDMQKKIAGLLALCMAFACLIALPAGAEPKKMDPAVWLARFDMYAAQFDLEEEYILEEWKYRVHPAIVYKSYSGVSVCLFGKKADVLEYVILLKSYSTDEVGKKVEAKALENLLAGSLSAAYAWFSTDLQDEDAAASLFIFAKAFKQCYPDGSDSQDAAFTWKGLQVRVKRMTLSTQVMWNIIIMPNF